MPRCLTRACGILLHPTSLPGRFGIGDLGPEAEHFVTYLVETGQTWWQMLPLGPTGFGNSPYQSQSSFAGNPLLISPDRMVDDGYLTSEELGDYPVLSQETVDFDSVRAKAKAHKPRVIVCGYSAYPRTIDFAKFREIADEVGALHRALAPFRRYRLNMTKIESRPSKRKAWEYFFFVDCDGHMNDRKVAKAIALLGEQCSFVKVLGSYPNSE